MMHAMTNRLRGIRSALAGAAFLCVATSSQPLAGQVAEGVDARWLPFVGCWEAVGGEDDAGLLCFRLDGQGAGLTNYIDGVVASVEHLVADGSRQQVSVEGCAGWESVDFSEDGRRAFTTTEFNCGSDEPRAGSGVMTFVADDTWVDIRTVHAGDEPFAWVQEYRLAGAGPIADQGVVDPAEGLGMAIRSARAAAAATLDLDDVIEASQRMDAKAVETWLVAKRDNFRPTGRELVALADAGVPEEVIDAVVAVSHPERFVVETAGPVERPEGLPRPAHYRGYMAFNPFWGSVWDEPYGYYGYAPYRYRYGYGSYGYGSYGYPGYGYWGYSPGYVIVAPRSGSGGRVYNGTGYRGRTSSDGGRAARPRGGAPVPSYSVGGSREAAGSARPSSGGARPRSGGGSTPSAVRRPSGGGSTPSAARRPSGGGSTPSAVRRPSGGGSTPSAASRPSGGGSTPSAARRPGGQG
jgi:hypothetical protein